MINLIALSKEDGWALVEHGGEISLVRPSYLDGVLPVTAEDLTDYFLAGFEAASEPPFTDIDQLTNFLRHLMTVERKNAPLSTEADPVSRLLKAAPRDVIMNFIDKARNELLGNGLFDATNLCC